jgi:hypothetical protein
MNLAFWHLFLIWTAGLIAGFFAAATLCASKDK